MLEIIQTDKTKLYLPSERVKLVRKTEEGDLMLCFLNPKDEVTWQKISSFSNVSGSKKIT